MSWATAVFSSTLRLAVFAGKAGDSFTSVTEMVTVMVSSTTASVLPSASFVSLTETVTK